MAIDKKRILVEEGYTALRSTRPLRKIPFEPWMECLKKRAHERNLERRFSDGTLSLDVHD